MASSLVVMKLVSSNLLPKSFPSTRQMVQAAQLVPRLFHSNVVREFDEGDDCSSNVTASRSGKFAPNSSADVLDPFASTRSISQILNEFDKFMNFPSYEAFCGTGAGFRRGWDARETEDGLYLRIDMPGFGKENVKISVEENTLIIKGELSEDESGNEERGRRYSSRIKLPEKLYRNDHIKAELKNGVLKVVVPRVKEEERSQVVHVKVE